MCGTENIDDFSELKRGARYAGGFQKDRPRNNLVLGHCISLPGDTETATAPIHHWIRRCRGPFRGEGVIQKSGEDDFRLPVSHTCFSTLDLPQYSSRERLSTALRVDSGTEGWVRKEVCTKLCTRVRTMCAGGGGGESRNLCTGTRYFCVHISLYIICTVQLYSMLSQCYVYSYITVRQAETRGPAGCTRTTL